MTDFLNIIRAGAVAVPALAIGIFLASTAPGAQTVDTQALSTESKSSKEVDIEANQMQVLDDEKKAIFSGKVDARRGDVRLNSDKLVVHYSEEVKQDGSKKTEATNLEADGNVVIVTKSQRITGQWAKMDIKANKLVVGGNVVVKQGQTEVRGKKLFVDLNSNKSEMTGGRVKSSFVPNQ